MSDDPVDDIPLPSNPILSEAESEAQIHADQHRERLAGAAAKSHKLGPTPGGLTNESRTNLHEQLRNTPAQQATKSEQPTSDTPRTDAFWKRFWKRWPVNEAGECAAIPSSSVRVAIDQELKQLERELAAAKAEAESLLVSDGNFRRKVDELRAENAELRKRPTMKEVQSHFVKYTETTRNEVMQRFEAFIEQQRRKEG